MFARMQSRTQERVSDVGEEETIMLRGNRGDGSVPDSRVPWGRSWGKK